MIRNSSFVSQDSKKVKKKKVCGAEKKTFNEIITKNFWTFVTDIQFKTLRKPLARQVNTNTSAQTHHKQTAKMKVRITLKSEKKKRVTYKRTAIRMFADFSLEIMVLKWHRNF